MTFSFQSIPAGVCGSRGEKSKGVVGWRGGGVGELTNKWMCDQAE